MLIRSSKKSDVASSEITSESVYMRRREFIGSAAGIGLAAASPVMLAAPTRSDLIASAAKTAYGNDEKLTPFKSVTSYNNFYEFGTEKKDPKTYAHTLTTDPWSVEVEGFAERTGKLALEDVLKGETFEERIYRLRCVEGWSMVIPWVGFPLANLIKRLQPTSQAKYVAFETLYRPEEMRGQKSVFSSIEWPYVEGLRLDEAMHPLTMLAVGVYGKPLPNQNGAPLRLVVPWKYGFKSIKSIVKIRFTDERPLTSWERSASSEYGFYSNVNPGVDHPRWSQKTERRLPSGFLSVNRIDSVMFNGYGEEVAPLYAGMDLTKNF
jgi:sulfoxide reductase catalytic subunit YedY